MKPTEITVTIGGENYIIRKAALGKYAKMIGAMQETMKIVGSMAKVDKDSILSSLPSLLANAYPELLKIVAIATDIPENVIDEKFDIADITAVMMAFFEVNDFEKAKKNIEALLNLWRKNPQSVESLSTNG